MEWFTSCSSCFGGLLTACLLLGGSRVAKGLCGRATLLTEPVEQRLLGLAYVVGALGQTHSLATTSVLPSLRPALLRVAWMAAQRDLSVFISAVGAVWMETQSSSHAALALCKLIMYRASLDTGLARSPCAAWNMGALAVGELCACAIGMPP